MYENITVHGIVLDTSLLKEYDKRLVILTSELGRITVFANGARRKNSQFTAVSQKFVMGSFILRPGRTSYTLVGSEIKETFQELSRDIEAVTYASYACEVTEHFTAEGVGGKDELNLLYVTFKAILAGRQSLELIRSIFEIKLMDIEGLGLEMNKCVLTGSDKNLDYISLEDGGIISGDILSGNNSSRVKRPMPVSGDVKYAIQYILSRNLSEVYSFDVSVYVAEELAEISSRYIELHSDRHFKSLDILSSLTLPI